MKTIITWFLIPATNFKRAVKFYETILNEKLFLMKDPGWDDMAMFTDPEDMDTVSWAIWTWENSKPSKEWVMIYLNASWKLDDILSRVEMAWWKINMEKTHIWKWWHIASFIDSEWNNIWLHSNK